MLRQLRLTTLVALFVVISAVAAAAAPFAYISQSGTASVFIVDTGTTPPSAFSGITIAVPAGPPMRSPWGVALSPDGSMLFVTNFAFSGGSVMAFNTSTGALIREVVVGTLPFGVAVHPVSGEVLVTVAANGSRVVVIQPSTWTNLGAPPVMASMLMQSPRGVAVHPSGTEIYVTNFFNDQLHIFNGVANADGTHDLITTIPMDVSPMGVAVAPDGSAVYVANQDSDTVTIMMNNADRTTSSVPAGSGPTGIAVSPNLEVADREVYVTNQWAGTVSVLDAAGAPKGSAIAVGAQPFGISTDGVNIYVAVMGDGKVAVIDRVTRAKTDLTAASPIGFGQFVNPAMKIATVMSLGLSPKSVILGSTSPVTATATLLRKNGGAPVAGASISFSVNGTSIGTAVTNDSGVAQGSFNPSTLAIGRHTVNASFAEGKVGSNVYLASEASAYFSVGYAFVWIKPTEGSITVAQAGSAVPLRFKVTNAAGTPIGDLAVVNEIVSAPCPSVGARSKPPSTRTYTTGTSDLRFNTDNFVYNWKTEKAWTNSCRELFVKLNDGSAHSAMFQFK